MWRTVKRVILWAVALVVVSCTGLAIYAIDLDTLRLMDPQLRSGIPGALKKLGEEPPTLAQMQAVDGPLRYEEKFIPGAAGDPPVRIVIITPKDAKPGRPGLLDMHGGGYMYGNPELSQKAFLDALVLKLGVTAVSVDYRLAPGTRYPGSLHDNYAALKWFHANAAQMGVDATRIAIIGVSAGGGHAAALGIYARDQAVKLPILFQMLICPMLDDRIGSTVDPGKTLGHLVWTRKDNREGWAALLGMEPGGDNVPAGAVPARVTNLTGLPPTYIAVGSLDLFATEDQEFAQRLKAAGVPVESHVFPGGFHAFELVIPEADVSKRARSLMEDYMVRGYGLEQAAP